MKNKLIIFLAIFFLAAKCHKEEIIKTDSAGIIISTPFLWEKTLYGGGTSITNSSFKYPILYNGNIGIPTIGDGKRYLTMINTESGEPLWQWSDLFHSETEEINISYSHQYNNLLTYQMGSRSYCIDLDNGTSHWKIQREQSFDGRINPNVKETYFTYSPILNEAGFQEQIAYLGNIESGELSPFLSANLSSQYESPMGIGGIIYITTIPDNENILLITYAEPLPNWEVNSFFGLYNTQTKVWEWDRKLLSPPNVNTSVQTPPQIYNDRVYANVGKKIVCHDLATGEQLWSKQFMQDFMFSGFIIEEDKLIGSNEDEILYCLNPENGNIIWQTEGSGTSSRLSYLNGIVYFAGGADGKLHAVDISNGKTVWLLEGKYLDDSYFKTNAIYVLPATGNQAAKVIALTHQHAYCFDAYQ